MNNVFFKTFWMVVAVVAQVGRAKPLGEMYAPGYGYYVNPVQSSQFHAQDELGQYSYNYNNVNSAKNEVRSADGVVRGSYSYVDAYGVPQVTNYISDALGFRVASSNLPVTQNAHLSYSAYAPAYSAYAPAYSAYAPAYHGYASAYSGYAPAYYYLNPAQVSSVQLNPVQLFRTDISNQAAVPAAVAVLPQSTVQQEVQQEILTQKIEDQDEVPDLDVRGGEAPALQVEPVQEAVLAIPAAEAVQAVPAVEAIASIPVGNVQPAAVPVVASSQFYNLNQDGSQYEFGYSLSDNSGREEKKGADGAVTGTYNYVDSEGHIQTMNYIADHLGFRAAGTTVPVAVAELPTPVEDTPEVAAAKAEHARLYAETVALNAKAEEEERAEQAQQAAVASVAVPVASVAPVAVPVASVAPVAVPVVAPLALSPGFVTHQPADASQYAYGYANEHSSKLEQRTPDGVVSGTYSYVDAYGRIQRVDYVSDAMGFRVAATNLPVHVVPGAQETGQVAGLVPVQVPIAQQAVPAAVTPQVVEVQVPAEPEKAAPVPEVVDVQQELIPILPDASSSEDPQQYIGAADNQDEAELDVRSGNEEEQAVGARTVVQVLPNAQPQQQIVSAPAQVQLVQLPYAAQYGYAYPNAYSMPITVVATPTAAQHHAQDELGQYSYGYNNVNSAKNEVRSADGVVRGSYSYVDAYGVPQVTNYISDALGFRVAATNLPAAPAA